jgi:anthranilate phosphoribosyltransferase
MLPTIASIVRKIAYGKDLTSEEARQALNVIGDNDFITDFQHSDGLYFLALTLGIMAKGPTADELLGFVRSLGDRSIHFSTHLEPERITDVSGTGGDRIKTFNIGTTASFIIAASGLAVAKQATRSYTGLTGSADVFKAVGLDPNVVRPSDVTRCLEEVGIVAFYTPAFTEGFRNRIDFLTKLKKIGLTYPTPWHLISWVYSPFTMRSRLYGVFSDKYLVLLARIFQDLGYARVMVVHGEDGLDEISNVGETKVAELVEGRIREYVITPEEMGVQRANAQDIQTLTSEEDHKLNASETSQDEKDKILLEGRSRNLAHFIRIIYGRDTSPRRDIVLLNAGAALYLGGKANTIRDGVNLSRSLIESKAAARKLEELSAHFAGRKDLESLKEQAGL